MPREPSDTQECAHPNARPSKSVPAMSCPDCGALFSKVGSGENDRTPESAAPRSEEPGTSTPSRPSHSPEPWYDGRPLPEWVELKRADYLRAVACVNACAGMSDPVAEVADLRRLKVRRFPIMDGPSIPWNVIAPYEAQAHKNHDQSLETLASRGGLATWEALAVLTLRRTRDVFTTTSEAESLAQLKALVLERAGERL